MGILNEIINLNINTSNSICVNVGTSFRINCIGDVPSFFLYLNLGETNLFLRWVLLFRLSLYSPKLIDELWLLVNELLLIGIVGILYSSSAICAAFGTA